MIKNVGIVSLSSGVLGEAFVRHELELGAGRLEKLGLSVRFMPHALDGLKTLEKHPEYRAADLLEAFRDPALDMILCAIGGDDTYRLLPYLFGNGELKSAVTDKVFLGFSDTTINHLMLHKAGLNTFYGQSFLSDVCELGHDMLPYTKRYFEELIATGTIREITPSDVWYDSRTDFGPAQMGTEMPSHPNGGFELLQGPPRFSARILGGCIDTLHDIFDGSRYADMPGLCREYGLFPAPEEWRGRILLLETSEEKMSPESFGRALGYLKGAGVFGEVSGILFGKPMDGTYEAEYKKLLCRIVDDASLPILANISIGHGTPRCIIPFGVTAHVDAQAQRIIFE